jgi:hypothetical protein
MNFFSFDPKDPVFPFDEWKLSFQVVTLENLYGLDPGQTTVTRDGRGWQLNCRGLSWAGRQERAGGSLQALIRREPNGQIRITINASAANKIRAIKILVRDLPPLDVLDLLDGSREVPPGGLIAVYPSAYDLVIPLWVSVVSDGTNIGLRAEDPSARAKRFAAYPERMGELAGRYTLECSHEEDARHFDLKISVPPWIIARNVDVKDFRGEHLEFAERRLGLQPWEARTDMPAWARDVRLCITLNGMHWSGFIFNDFARMVEIVRHVTSRIDGKHVLAYLPGWEGRYYWQYGDYRPDPRLGGDSGFKQLCAEARDRGVHLMPMVGGNVVNAWFPNYKNFGPSSLLKSGTGIVYDELQPDWDMSRSGDNGLMAWMNPGAPAWQDELVRQIRALKDRFGFDAVFLDTVQHWRNDPDHNIREGLQQLVARLKQGNPDLMVAGEDWWDGILNLFPIYLRSGWWRQVPPWVERYARLIAHLCEGEASRGSTGCHELGQAPYERMPDSPLYIPTLQFVDGTLEKAKSEIDAVIAQAKSRR